jgi:hypothetical protein
MRVVEWISFGQLRRQLHKTWFSLLRFINIESNLLYSLGIDAAVRSVVREESSKSLWYE